MKLYPSGSAPACIYVTPKMYKFFPSESFPKLRPIISSIGAFNHNPANICWSSRRLEDVFKTCLEDIS